MRMDDKEREEWKRCMLASLKPGHCSTVERRIIPDLFPPPPPIDHDVLEFEIELALAGGKPILPKDSPSTEEQVEQWASENNVRVYWNRFSGDMELMMMQPKCSTCEMPMEKTTGKVRVFATEMRGPAINPMTALAEVTIVDGLRCPKCGKFSANDQ